MTKLRKKTSSTALPNMMSFRVLTIPGSIYAANENNNLPTSEQVEKLHWWISSVTPLLDAEVNADPVLNIYVVKVIKDNDAKASQDDFLQAKKAELEGLKSRILWNIVDGVDVCDGERIIGGRFILSLENYGAPNETKKGRFIAQGFSDHDKLYMVHSTSTLRAASIRIIVSIAAIKRFRIFSHNVTQAYLQCKYELLRKI